jgi:hypothetical protein
LTISKPDTNYTIHSKGEFERILTSSGFPLIFLKNHSSALDLDGKAVKDFISKAQEHAGDSKGLDRLRLLTGFVYEHIQYDINKMGYPSLENVLSNKSGGVCSHKAAALHLVLAYDGGWNVKSEGGVVTHRGIMLGPHTWLSVVIDGVKYLSDPTNMMVEEYAKFDIERVVTGLIQLRTVEHHGPFNMLRKEIVDEIKEVYTDIWEWDGPVYRHITPKAITDAAAKVAPFYEEFRRKSNECVFNAKQGKVDEMEIAKHYSIWAGESAKETALLDKLDKTSNQDPNRMHIS